MKKILLSLIAFASMQLLAQPVITNQPASRAMWAGGNVTFAVGVSNSSAFTYQWQLNGTNLPNNIITTVAGGFLFNNLPATNTPLNGPNGVAQDNAGNMFIADAGGQVIRKVDTNGMATIVAGNGSASFSGDGGAATNAGLNFPDAVVVDSVGNLFITDYGNYRIRKVDTNGIITTFAGNGQFGNISQVGDNGAATNAQINNPVGLCLDGAGNLFIADTYNHRVRKVGTNGIITTVAGNGGGGFQDNTTATGNTINHPTGVVMDSSNNLYIADSGNNRIRKVTSGIISTVAGSTSAGYSGDGGAATSAKLNNPTGVVLDASHNIFIVDTGNQCIRKIGTNNIITTVAGNGTNFFSGDGGMATNASLYNPESVSVDNIGNLVIADAINNRIRKVGTNGIITTVAGCVVNNESFATNATFNTAIGIASDFAGNLYIADAYNNRIREVETNGIISTVAGNGIASYAGDGGAATNASFKNLWSVAVDSFGDIFIADRLNNRVRKVDTNGVVSTVAGTGSPGFSGDGNAATNAAISSPQSVICDFVGNLFILDAGNNRIRKVDTNGIITTVAGNGGFGYSGDGGMATNAKLFAPTVVSIDSVGNLLIDDAGNYRIRKVDTNGVISTVAGNGTPSYSGDGGVATNASLSATTWGVTADSIGDIFIADTSSQHIRKVDTNGIITTIAGNGVQGFSGDGSSANNASLSSPRGLATDGTGNLYVMDTGNNRVRKLSYVEFADQPSFTLTNVTTANAGNYQLVVTGSGGSVTSSVVNLTVATSPLIYQTVLNPDSSVALNFVSQPNSTNAVLCATNLTPPVVWQSISTNIAGADGNWQFTDTNAASYQTRFYRSLAQ